VNQNEPEGLTPDGENGIHFIFADKKKRLGEALDEVGC